MPFANTAESRQWLSRRNQSIYGIGVTSHAMLTRELDEGEGAVDPFERIADELRQSDLVEESLDASSQ